MLFAVVIAQALFAQSKPVLRLEVGDVVHVEVTTYNSKDIKDFNTGDYEIARDGSVYGTTFGRVVLVGKSVSEAQTLIRKALAPFVKPDEVFVSLLKQSPQKVYLYVTGDTEDVSSATPRGPIDMMPGLTLTQILSSVAVKDPQLWSVTVNRDGRDIFSQPLNAPITQGINLMPNDLILVAPSQSIQVWISGYVPKAGRFRVQAGTTLDQLIDLAGGLSALTIVPPIDATDLRASILRNSTAIEVQLGHPNNEAPYVLQDGDQVTISALPIVRFSVLGQVLKPGEFEERGDISLFRAISTAGGVSPDGSLQQVIVYRGRELYRVDASAPEAAKPAKPFLLQTGDLVFVQTNQKVFYVFGTVLHAGRYPMEDHRTYHLSDALAVAGGLTPDGVLRRIAISRPGPDGKSIVTFYNLDEYLKNGKLAADPVIEPGDEILFTTKKGLSLDATNAFLSFGVLISSLVGKL